VSRSSSVKRGLGAASVVARRRKPPYSRGTGRRPVTADRSREATDGPCRKPRRPGGTTHPSAPGGDSEGLADLLLALADVARDEGDYDQAHAWCAESVQMYRNRGDGAHVINALKVGLERVFYSSGSGSTSSTYTRPLLPIR
jgi:hypothetical protein